MNALHATLIFAAIAVIQLLFGGGDGSRFIYTLPGFLLLGISGVLTLFSFWKAPARMNRACLVTSLLLALYVFARIARSPSAWLASFDLFAVMAALLVYFVTALFVSRNRARCVMVYGLLILALAQVAVGVFQFARDPGFNPMVSDGRGEAGFRASGFFISPNHLAGFLEVAFLLATSFCFWSGFRALGKVLFGYLALVCLAGLVLTGSRGGYLSATVGFVVFTFLSMWTIRARLSQGLLPRLVGIIVAILLIGGGLAWVTERSFALRERTNTVFVSSDIRLQLWEAAWKQFKVAPVFGTGSRTYAYYGRMFRSPQIQDDPVFTHNDWLQTLAEYGIAGILLVIGFVVAHLRHGAQRWLRMADRLSAVTSSSVEKHALALQIGTLGAISACLVHGFMDFNLHIPANLLLVAFLFGILATRRTRSEEQPGWIARAMHAIPASLGLWMLITGGPRFPAELFVESARGKFATGQIGPALRDAGKAIRRGARNPELYFQIGEVQRILHHTLPSEEMKEATLEEAHEAYAEALAIYPQDVKLVLRDAWALGRMGLFQEAEVLLAQAQHLDPNSPTVWTYSALHWQLRNKPAEALADCRKAEQLGAGIIALVASELHEKIDPKELEKLLQTGPAAEPK
jgi:O-antigen ligase